MVKTKEKILKTALDLFNTKGLARVTLRNIADEMGISQGNLNYHFKKRKELIEALYFTLVQEIDDKMQSQTPTEKPIPSLKQLMMMSSAVMSDLLKYRFIMLDFVQIMRENQKIKSHFTELQNLRKQQFLYFFDVLNQQGLMRQEQLPDEYVNLYHRLQLLGDFWISSATISANSINKKTMNFYSNLINQTIYPYLTKQGQKEYLEVSESLH